jgi:hypothetical protein
MYFAYFHSFFKYGILFWGNFRNLKNVFKLQKRAIRLIANVSCTANCMLYLKNFKIMTLPCLYIYELFMYAKVSVSTRWFRYDQDWLCVNKSQFVPVIFEPPCSYKTNSVFHSYNTWNKSDLFISSHNTKLFEQNVTYNGMLINNKLSSEIISIKSTTRFKKILTKCLLEKSFYSVEEFMTANS